MCSGRSAIVRAGYPVDQSAADRDHPCANGIRGTHRRNVYPMAGILPRRGRRLPRLR